MTMSTFVSVHVLGKQGKIKKESAFTRLPHSLHFDAVFIDRMVERGREIVAKHGSHFVGK